MLNLMSDVCEWLVVCPDSEVLVLLRQAKSQTHSRKGWICWKAMPAQYMLHRFATVMDAGEQTWHGDAGKERSSPDTKQRRLNLMKAVEGDGWSAVIDSQTQHTMKGALVDDGILTVSILVCDIDAQAAA